MYTVGDMLYVENSSKAMVVPPVTGSNVYIRLSLFLQRLYSLKFLFPQIANLGHVHAKAGMKNMTQDPRNQSLYGLSNMIAFVSLSPIVSFLPLVFLSF